MAELKYIYKLKDILITTYMFSFIKIQTARESPRVKNMADENLKQV